MITLRCRSLQPVRCQYITTGSTDTYGYLKDSACGDIQSNDDGAEQNFLLSADVQPGTYYVAVRGYWPSNTGAYTLHVDFIPQSTTTTTPAVTTTTPAVTTTTPSGTTTTTAPAVTTTTTPSSTTTTPTSPGKKCPISKSMGRESGELGMLRQFRDEVMAKSEAGQEYVRLYYAHGRRYLRYWHATRC